MKTRKITKAQAETKDSKDIQGINMVELANSLLDSKVTVQDALNTKYIDIPKFMEIVKSVREAREVEAASLREAESIKAAQYKALEDLIAGKTVAEPVRDAIQLAMQCGIVIQKGEGYELINGKLVTLYEVGCKVLGFGNPRKVDLRASSIVRSLTMWTQDFLHSIGHDDKRTFKSRMSAIASHMNSSITGLNKGSGRDTLIFS